MRERLGVPIERACFLQEFLQEMQSFMATSMSSTNAYSDIEQKPELGGVSANDINS